MISWRQTTRGILLLAGMSALMCAPKGAAGQGGETSAATPVRVQMDATTILELDRDVATIVMANPEFAEIKPITKRRFFIFGRKLGRTTLLILDPDGKTIRDTMLTVVMPDNGVVTVTRGIDKDTTYSCDPRCTPTDVSGRGGPGGGGNLSQGGGPPPPPPPTPVTPPAPPPTTP